MDQVRHGREKAAIARRFLCRTLTVVGGAAAGTAIAWFLSTGTAVADTPADPAAGLLGDATPVLAEAVTPLGGTLEVLADGLAESPRASLDLLGDRLTETAAHVDVLPGTGLDNELDTGLDTGLDGVLAAVEHVGLPVGAEEVAPAEAAPEPVPALVVRTTGKVTGAGVDPEHTAARTATERAYATGMPHRGSPEPTTPHTPTWPAPFSPNVPIPGHTGHAGANLADSAPFATFPWLDRAPGSASGLTAAAAEAPVSGRAGDQPGTAPD